MNERENGKKLTPEEKFFEFAAKCPAFSLTADDLYVLAGVEEKTTKEILFEKAKAGVNNSAMKERIKQEKEYIDRIKQLQEECEAASKERRDEILHRIQELRQKLCDFEKETKIKISEEDTEERASINTIGQLDVN